jgi:hypothetical protein
MGNMHKGKLVRAWQTGDSKLQINTSLEMSREMVWSKQSEQRWRVWSIQVIGQSQRDHIWSEKRKKEGPNCPLFIKAISPMRQELQDKYTMSRVSRKRKGGDRPGNPQGIGIQVLRQDKGVERWRGNGSTERCDQSVLSPPSSVLLSSSVLSVIFIVVINRLLHCHSQSSSKSGQ